MSKIKRQDISGEWAHSGVVQAGEYVFVSYCMKNEGQSIQRQIHGAFDVLSERLRTAGLSLESVVQMDCLFKNIGDLVFLGEIIEERFQGNYPARKAFETAFIRDGILFQADAVAYAGQRSAKNDAAEH